MTQLVTGFFPARFSTPVPPVKGFKQVADPTFLRGHPVFTDSGLLDQCGANPTLIAGMALADHDTSPLSAAANNPTVLTGYYDGVSVSLAVDTVEFSGLLVNNSSATIAPADADLGAQYGIKAYTINGITCWRVDKNLTAADARVVITNIDTFNNLILFKVLKAYQQYGAA